MSSSRRRFLKNAAALSGVALGQNVTSWSRSDRSVGTLAASTPEMASPEKLLAAHAAEHGTTVAADSRWHVRRGELPTCGHENDGQRASDEREDRRDRSEYRPSKKRWFNDDGKSRFCRKRWWC